MKYLGLLRHAKSDWSDGANRDFDRGLNERGHAGAAIMGRHIRRFDQTWDVFLASPAERVVQTLAGAHLGIDHRYDPRLYLASPDVIMDVIKEKAGDAASVLIAGHNPGLQEMLLELVAPENEDETFREAAVKFPTAAFAILELPIAEWSELGAQNAALTHFKRPRDLDPSLGPSA